MRRTCTSGPLHPGRAAAALVGTLALDPAIPTPLAAQRYWRENLYPYAYYSTIDGLWGAFHYGRYSPLDAVERPEPDLASASFDAGASTQGSYAVAVDAQAPAWWEGWRARLTLTTARSNRMGYYGLGNDTQYAVDSLTTAGSYFYRVSRTSTADPIEVGPGRRQEIGRAHV